MGIDQAVRIALAFLPVLLFLAAWRVLDSYKLVSLRMVAAALAAGALAAGACYEVNTVVFQHLSENRDLYVHFGAPVVEELAKGAFWVFLIATAQVAFMVDSAICGFAVGTGFALFENFYYLQALEDRGLGIWLLRGFGTAVMH